VSSISQRQLSLTLKPPLELRHRNQHTPATTHDTKIGKYVVFEEVD
jgi:hypothetical protein